jgi:hypothetical protein
MKRTQLYLDEEMARTLETLSRQKGTTISELVRVSLRKTYMPGKDLDKVGLARTLTGIWQSRGDLGDGRATVQKLRKGSRPRRIQIG